MQQFCYQTDQNRIEELLRKRRFNWQDHRFDLVKEILDQVSSDGDQALIKLTERFDQVSLTELRVGSAEIEEAYRRIEPGFIKSLKKSITNVSNYHRQQLPRNWFTYDNGNMVGQLITPLQRIGAYVPGGRAAYPSSVVMTVAPARVAGVAEVVLVSPPDQQGKVNPYTLVAAAELGVEEIYKIGGAQAVAALAFGTETIRAVDKIVGPGNIYVTLAKKLVYGLVEIDLLAGPSELLVLADQTARPELIAADLLAQAEHDPLAVPILISDSADLLREVRVALDLQLRELPRAEIARRSVMAEGIMIIVKDRKEGIELVNRFAPEHLELLVKNPLVVLGEIRNAGAIFIGEYSPEPVGDYLAGPNHVLPTGGTARFASPLNIDDYLKKSSLIYYREEELSAVAGDIIKLAELEQLDGHARAVAIRFNQAKQKE
ncbi:MAG: histidinol dehydrogenase [Halanaerobiales bacterium]|nr:histidinol dehydrogenase [Halanaerobiales bacterium]